MRPPLRALALALAGVVLPLGVSPARGLPDRSAPVHALRASVAAGDEITIGCGRDPGPSAPGVVLGMYSVSDASGATVSRGTAGVTFWNSDYAAWTVGNDSQVILESDPPTEEGNAVVSRQVTPAAGTLRAAWAAWGIEAECIILVNGVRLTDFAIDEEAEGLYALPTDFRGGAAVGAIRCAQAPIRQCPGAAVAAAQTHATRARGHLFAFFLPNGAGLFGAQGPSGEDLRAVAPISAIVVAKQSVGDWTFSLTASVTNGRPVLWTLSLPA